jgi:hypothetical protein
MKCWPTLPSASMPEWSSRRTFWKLYAASRKRSPGWVCSSPVIVSTYETLTTRPSSWLRRVTWQPGRSSKLPVAMAAGSSDSGCRTSSAFQQPWPVQKVQ